MHFRRVTGGRFVGHAGNTAARKAVWFYPSWKPLARLREQEMLVEIIPSFTTSHSTHSKLVYSSISKAGIPLHTYELSQYLHTPKHHNPIQQSLTAGAIPRLELVVMRDAGWNSSKYHCQRVIVRRKDSSHNYFFFIIGALERQNSSTITHCGIL